ncbi:MAG: SLBB domain-containing protein, partial [Melioribacteraceae bacterium]
MFKNYIWVVVILLSSFFLNEINAQFSSDKSSSSSLEMLTLINVTLGGDFPISGTYPASRTERVDQLITRIFTTYKAELLRSTPDEKLLGIIKTSINEYSKRNIILKRFSGEKISIDLVKFRLTGNFEYNPYLKNDDVIIFPPLDLVRNFVDISGAVNKEIKFQFVEGEKLSDAILIAQGLNSSYLSVDSVSISRLSYDGLMEEILKVKISENPILQRGDRIRILADANKKRDYSVLVLGEVNRPGKIYVTKNKTTLKEVIQKVGGFTNQASLGFSELIRNSNTISVLQKEAFEASMSGTKLTLEEEQKILNSKRHELL